MPGLTRHPRWRANLLASGTDSGRHGCRIESGMTRLRRHDSRPLRCAGRLNRVELPVPLFRQADPQWRADLLGPTPGTLGAEGCAAPRCGCVCANADDTATKRTATA